MLARWIDSEFHALFSLYALDYTMVLGIYGSKLTEPEGKVVYIAIKIPNHSTSDIHVIGYAICYAAI